MLVERAEAQGERTPLITAIDADIEIVTVAAGKTVTQLERGGRRNRRENPASSSYLPARIDAEGDATDRIGEIASPFSPKLLPQPP